MPSLSSEDIMEINLFLNYFPLIYALCVCDSILLLTLKWEAKVCFLFLFFLFVVNFVIH